MFILHVTEYCHAESIGGTERYVLDLIRGLEDRGSRNAIAWMTRPPREPFEADEVRILPLPTGAMRVDTPPAELEASALRLLEKEKPDLLHFHTFGRSEALVARVARGRGIPHVFTYHSPAWSCRRGDLLAWGREACDGQVRAVRCSACKLHQRLGGPPCLHLLGAMASIPAGWLFAQDSNLNRRRRISFVADTARFRQDLEEFQASCRTIFACAQWSVSVLQRNGAPASAIRFCPQGVSPRSKGGSEDSAEDLPAPATKPFVIAYVGRLTPQKGVAILAEGFHALNVPDVRLRIYGWTEHESVGGLVAKLKRLAKTDTRIELVPKLPFDRMMAEYRHLDLLAIPSVCFETGPLVMLEALQMGVPVYGSNRLGQLKLLQTRGQVVEPNTPDGWSRVLEGACTRHAAGQWEAQRRRARGDGTLRTMKDVAGEMFECYEHTKLRGPMAQ